MKPISKIMLILGMYSTLNACQQETQNKRLVLWYDKPAEHFEQALVLGNGKVGATVFGGVESDKIYLNDATLWSGEPVDPKMNPDAYKYIPEVREALNNEDYGLADYLITNVQGKFSESFAPLGTMYMDIDHEGTVSNYYRELDISKAISLTKYEVDGVKFEREYFISYPDKVMVIKLKADKKKALTLDVRFESLLKYSFNTDQDMLRIDGYAPYHAEPNYMGNIPDAVQFDKDRGIRFSSYFKVKETDGKVSKSDSTLSIRDASEVVLLVSIETSFNGFDQDPVKEGNDNKAIAEQQLINTEKKSFDEIERAHIKEHQTYFNRVSLTFGETTAPNIPTDERIKRYTTGAEDKDLEVLYFQFGRYLLISGSRTKDVPMNLQGIWNPYMRPPWSSNYTTNINVETNYWLAENANLSEFHQPMLSWIENVSKTGEVTAKTFLGVNNGWTACHNSDIWAISNPVGDFGKGSPCYAAWFMGGAWLSTHLWEHYTFTQDKEYLKNAYPVIKGAAQFCLEWLVEGKNGYLMTSPGTSPENMFITPDGHIAATSYGSTADLAMIRELFEQTIAACEVLQCDPEFRKNIEAAHSRLQPYKIGAKGNLQEWFYDWEDMDKEHRHQSHLFGLFPGHHITPQDTSLANACRKTLEMRGPDGMGWSFGWRICLWSRLYDGENAYKVLRSLIKFVKPTGPQSGSSGGGIYANLFSAGPPLQIDGNFSGASGIAEMLLQSTAKEIIIIPAIPEVWSTGSFKGLCARGGFEVDAEWKNEELVKLKILSKAGNKCKIHFKDKMVEFDTEKGKIYTIDSELKVSKNTKSISN